MGWPEIMIWGGFAVFVSMGLYGVLREPDKGDGDKAASICGAWFITIPLFSIAIGAWLLIWGAS